MSEVYGQTEEDCKREAKDLFHEFLNEKKLCPLLLHQFEREAECVEEKCAWWNLNGKCCAVAMIAEVLNDIALEKGV